MRAGSSRTAAGVERAPARTPGRIFLPPPSRPFFRPTRPARPRRGLTSKEFVSALVSSFISALVFVAACSVLPTGAAAQKKPKKPKPALKDNEARRVIAQNTPGFALNTGAVNVLAVSDAGVSPVTVTAAVTTAFRFEEVKDEKGAFTNLFNVKRWRAVEFRNGDRSWEEFDLLADALGAERLERARAALELLVSEFQSQQRASKSVEPLTRGPLTVKQLSAQGSSALAEVAVECVFRLSKDRKGKWVVEEVSVGGESSGDPEAVWRAANTRKAERARAEMAVVRAALEAFRREHGFYVVADSDAVLMDHLSPSYIERIIRLDPWHRPYRYAGTRDAFTLVSDGPDGKQGTPDDVTASP